MGIPDLQAFFKLEPLLRQRGITVFSANFTLYGDISHRVMSSLRDFSPEVEVYSIDEMFLQLEGIPANPKEYGQKIKTTLWHDIRMPVCVGIAPTKTLAKLANHTAKKIEQTGGVCVLDTPAKWQWVLKRIATDKIWGVGSRTSRRLAALGINTAYQLATAEPKYLRKQFNVNLERTIEELNGRVALSLEQQPPAKKQIFCTRSFGTKPDTLKPIENAISAYAARAAEKLRAQQHFVNTLQVFIHTSPHEPGYYSNSQIVKLPYPTDDTRIIVAAARRAVQAIYQPGKRYLKAGIGLLELSDRQHLQADLFTPGQTLAADALMQALDKINQRYGQGAAYLASEGVKQRWRMRQNFLSPAYTTRWPDIPAIRC